MSVQNLEILISQQAERIAKKMISISQWANSEEDARLECNKPIDDFRTRAGIKDKDRQDYGLAGGRIDSKYGGVIIEHKHPNSPARINENPRSSADRVT